MLTLRLSAPILMLGVAMSPGGVFEGPLPIEGAPPFEVAPGIATDSTMVVRGTGSFDLGFLMPGESNPAIYCRPAVLVPTDVGGTVSDRLAWYEANAGRIGPGDAIVVMPARAQPVVWIEPRTDVLRDQLFLLDQPRIPGIEVRPIP